MVKGENQHIAVEIRDAFLEVLDELSHIQYSHCFLQFLPAIVEMQTVSSGSCMVLVNNLL